MEKIDDDEAKLLQSILSESGGEILAAEKKLILKQN